jgi:hypothetical protein
VAGPGCLGPGYLDAPVIVTWDNLNTHLSRKMQAFTTGHPDKTLAFQAL